MGLLLGGIGWSFPVEFDGCWDVNWCICVLSLFRFTSLVSSPASNNNDRFLSLRFLSTFYVRVSFFLYAVCFIILCLIYLRLKASFCLVRHGLFLLARFTFVYPYTALCLFAWREEREVRETSMSMIHAYITYILSIYTPRFYETRPFLFFC